MDASSTSVAPEVPFAALACLYMSAALQFDYLSSGAGHRQSTAVLKARRERAAPAVAVRDAEEAEEAPTEWDALPDVTALYLSEVRARERLSSSEEYRLAAQAFRGDARAAARLAEHNLGLVVMIARRYASGPIALLDLIQEGNLGLLKACGKFDPERGYRFSTYAKWWIREAIETALLTQSQVVRVPVHAAKALRRASKQAQGSAEPAEAPTAALAHCLLVDSSDLGAGAVERGETAGVVETLPAPAEAEPHERLQQRLRLAHLLSVLELLSEQERLVLVQRFGLDGEDPRTLTQVAAPLGVSHERVRQIEAQALERIRNGLRVRRVWKDEML